MAFLDQIWAILYDPEEVLGKINDKLYLQNLLGGSIATFSHYDFILSSSFFFES